MSEVDVKKSEEEVLVDPEVDAEAGGDAPSSSEDDLKKETEPVEDEEEEFESPFDNVRHMIFKGLYYAFLLLIVVFLLAAFIIDFKRAKALFVITCLVVGYQLYPLYLKYNEEQFLAMEDKVITFLEKADTDLKTGAMLASLFILIMVIMIASTVRDSRNLVSLFGLLVFLGLTWLGSWHPTKVAWRPVLGAIFIQFIFGYIVIRTDWGFEAIDFLSFIFTTLLGFTIRGSSFVFGWLTDGRLFIPGWQVVMADETVDPFSIGPPFFFNVLPSVIFFSSLMSVGYYIGVLPWLVRKLGYLLSILLGTSASESLSAAGNIFVGQTEAPLLVKPFFSTMTESELHAVMTGGFATIAGSVFGIYLSFGIPGVNLLAASVMSAPAALAISKLACPETEESPTSIRKKGAFEIPSGGGANVVDAAAQGAVIGTQLMLNIAGNLIAFLAMVEMIDQLFQYCGDRVDLDLSFNRICEIVFFPMAWLLGVDGDDCEIVARLIGFKIIINEFFAYEQLQFNPEINGAISARSYYLASYALCGFSNLGSIGIQLGGLTPLAPEQGPKLAKLVISALIAGNTACLMTACIAGIFYED